MSSSIPTFYGVDFSGAARAGENTWIARVDRRRSRPVLSSLDNLATLAGSPQRGPALAHLVALIRASDRALWALDFPFSLPLCLLPDGSWTKLLAFRGAYDETAYHFGHWCLARAKALGGRNHLPRLTDAAARAPFSCYHYRIAYQTFHGALDAVLAAVGACHAWCNPRPLCRTHRNEGMIHF